MRTAFISRLLINPLFLKVLGRWIFYSLQRSRYTMKKTILIVLMVPLIITPCFAQEVETDGLFSLNRTLWLLVAFGGGNQINYGFYEGDVYIRELGYPAVNICSLLENSSYLDLLAVSFFKIDYSSSGAQYGIMYPLGIGMMLSIYKPEDAPPRVNTYMLIKGDNNWTPPPECENIN
jgi:hypothetical protein